jgi:septal ring factor EnvC (AmiA/AmiB activator)
MSLSEEQQAEIQAHQLWNIQEQRKVQKKALDEMRGEVQLHLWAVEMELQNLRQRLSELERKRERALGKIATLTELIDERRDV